MDAQGQVARFEQILPEYLAAPEITRKRIYLETMQEVMGSSSKIILDTPEGSTPVLYLPLPEQRTSQDAAPTVDTSSLHGVDSTPVTVTEKPVSEPLPLPRNDGTQTSGSVNSQRYGSSYNTSGYGRSVR